MLGKDRILRKGKRIKTEIKKSLAGQRFGPDLPLFGWRSKERRYRRICMRGKR